jgi:tetratricopeptide (TPR) repeat protein
MPDKPPDDKDGLVELLKKLWLPVAGFISVVTLAYNFYKLWLGDQATITYISAGALLIVLSILLGWVWFSKRTVVQRKKSRNEPRYSKTYRQISLGLFGILWLSTGLGGWLLYENQQSQAETIEKKVIVLVAQFDGPEETYGLHDQIIEDLHQATKEYNDTVIIDSRETVTAGQGSEYARELGKKENADLVIWAWYRPTENPNITIHIENLLPAEFTSIQESEIYQPQATLAQLESFEIQRQVGSETATLVTFLTGLLKLGSGDYQTAVERFEQMLEEDDLSTFVRRSDLYFNLGYSYDELGEYKRAIENYDKVIEINQRDVSAYNNRGIVYKHIGDYVRAIEDFDKALEINPQDLNAYTNRGSVYYDLRDYYRAIEDFGKAIEINPSDAVAYCNHGIAYYRLGDRERAIQDFDKAIESHPQYACAYINRANVLSELEKYQLAIKDYNKAIEINPQDTIAYINRGALYAKLGKYRRAIRDYDKAIEINPKSADAYYNRGIAHHKLRENEQALEDYGRTIAIDPQAWDAYINRGNVYDDLGQYELAIQNYDKAIEINPQYALAYKNRGNTYQRLGNVSKAEADFKKYEELTGQKP